jgi:hypothetical protein
VIVDRVQATIAYMSFGCEIGVLKSSILNGTSKEIGEFFRMVFGNTYSHMESDISPVVPCLVQMNSVITVEVGEVKDKF